MGCWESHFWFVGVVGGDGLVVLGFGVVKADMILFVDFVESVGD